MKEQLDKMTWKDQRNYQSIVSKRWKDLEEVGNKEEEPVFRKGIYKGKKISYVAQFDSSCVKKMLKEKSGDKLAKDGIEQFFIEKRGR